ncbi:MAG: quinone-dependent dihydroorotate dehydrogenase [Rhizobiaceae bacterium]|nr:quinone-dependent dihydroorotate dehydrogenase [Rhizobiaceae bacterium]
MSLFKRILRPALFHLDAEQAHKLSLLALKRGLTPPIMQTNDQRLAVNLFGLNFPNPVGLAAGYDKNAEVPEAILRLGFGFTEVGSLTPHPQSGNPKPRVFRLPEDNGVINRMGFNNDGHAAAVARLEARKARGGIIGVNIGANKDSDDFIADYELGLEKFWQVADYFTANISSPNTPGLRDLQAKDSLAELLKRLADKRNTLVDATKISRPLLLKIAPDLNENLMDDIAHVVTSQPLDGLIISNTTLARNNLKNIKYSDEAGGLSGRPLFEKSTIILAQMRQRIGKDLPIIGVGGIDSAASAIQKLEAGANLIQLYSGMVFQGPDLAAKINAGIVTHMNRENISHVSQLTGTSTGKWTSKKLIST